MFTFWAHQWRSKTYKSSKRSWQHHSPQPAFDTTTCLHTFPACVWTFECIHQSILFLGYYITRQSHVFPVLFIGADSWWLLNTRRHRLHFGGIIGTRFLWGSRASTSFLFFLFITWVVNENPIQLILHNLRLIHYFLSTWYQLINKDESFSHANTKDKIMKRLDWFDCNCFENNIYLPSWNAQGLRRIRSKVYRALSPQPPPCPCHSTAEEYKSSGDREGTLTHLCESLWLQGNE